MTAAGSWPQRAAGGPPLSDSSGVHVYFQHGRFRVTDDIVRARTRSIQLSTIEGVEVSRPLFAMALAGCAGLGGVSLIFGDLLYWHEIALFLILAAGGLYLAWQVGSLRVFSKLTREKGWAVFWWHAPLRQMREAIETAMEVRARGRQGSQADERPNPSSRSAPDDDATIIQRPGRRF
jgi:hypothetical protein